MTKTTKNRIIEIFCGKYFPLLLLVVMACTYAVQLPRYGFYLDDWVSVAAYDQGGEEGLLAFGINDSRPFAAWVTAKFFALLGTGIIRWQIITLFWRYAAALTCFCLLSRVWPQAKLADGFIALFFGVFPYFKHQAICIAYFMILMQYFVVLLSFLLTVLALQTGSRGTKAALFLLSYLTSLFHLACLEYYLSLEAVRLLLIFFVLKKRDGKDFLRTAKKAVLTYIPYALILIFILGYRFVYIPSLSPDVRTVNLFSKYQGLNIILHFIGLFLQYLTEALLGVWYRSINPSGLDLTIRNTQFAFGMGILVSAAVFFLLRKVRSGKSGTDQSAHYEMLFLGAAAMMLGFLPGIAIDISPASESVYHDRYLLPSFFGIAVFSVTWVICMFQKDVVRNILLSAMIAVAVFFQIQNAYWYRYSWKNQQQFQWQLKERVPDLAENTAVVSDGVTAGFMGGWADGSMLLEMYGKHNGINPTPYWYFNVGEDNFLSVIGTDEPLYIKSKMYEFTTDSENILLVTKPEYGRCAWVLDEADIDNPLLPAEMRRYLPYQNKSRIIPDSDHRMPESIFGKDGPHDWCYYFEKADLAFDLQNYEEAVRLFEEFTADGIRFGNAVEMRPFIKSAAFAGDWQKAAEWTRLANSLDPDVTSEYFENLWRIIDRDTPPSPEKIEAIQNILGSLAAGE